MPALDLGVVLAMAAWAAGLVGALTRWAVCPAPVENPDDYDGPDEGFSK